LDDEAVCTLAHPRLHSLKYASVQTPAPAAVRVRVLAVKAGRHMNIIIWLVIGGVVGWVASMVMGTNERQGLVLNVVVGIVGAVLGGWLLGGLFGSSTINQGNFSLMGLLVSFLGAVVLLALAKLVRGAAKR
jgi:uncharacterized membrane protein YeaQ/YmgE (transglycosylase-associated protein family)